jgi:hypothetical protein
MPLPRDLALPAVIASRLGSDRSQGARGNLVVAVRPPQAGTSVVISSLRLAAATPALARTLAAGEGVWGTNGQSSPNRLLPGTVVPGNDP